MNTKKVSLRLTLSFIQAIMYVLQGELKQSPLPYPF